MNHIRIELSFNGPSQSPNLTKQGVEVLQSVVLDTWRWHSKLRRLPLTNSDQPISAAVGFHLVWSSMAAISLRNPGISPARKSDGDRRLSSVKNLNGSPRSFYESVSLNQQQRVRKSVSSLAVKSMKIVEQTQEPAFSSNGPIFPVKLSLFIYRLKWLFEYSSMYILLASLI